MTKICIPPETRFFELHGAVCDAYARHVSFNDPVLMGEVHMILVHGVLHDHYTLPKGVVSKEARQVVKDLNAALTSWARYDEPNGKLSSGERASAFSVLIPELGKRIGEYANRRRFEKLKTLQRVS